MSIPLLTKQNTGYLSYYLGEWDSECFIVLPSGTASIYPLLAVWDTGTRTVCPIIGLAGQRLAALLSDRVRQRQSAPLTGTGRVPVPIERRWQSV